jgi:hypothetical protein
MAVNTMIVFSDMTAPTSTRNLSEELFLLSCGTLHENARSLFLILQKLNMVIYASTSPPLAYD